MEHIALGMPLKVAPPNQELQPHNQPQHQVLRPPQQLQPPQNPRPRPQLLLHQHAKTPITEARPFAKNTYGPARTAATRGLLEIAKRVVAHAPPTTLHLRFQPAKTPGRGATRSATPRQNAARSRSVRGIASRPADYARKIRKQLRID